MKTPTTPRHPAGRFLAASLCAVFLLSLSGCGGGGGGGGGSTASTTTTTPDPPTVEPPRPRTNFVSTIGPIGLSPTNPVPSGSSAEFALGTRDPYFMPGGEFEQANDDYSPVDSFFLNYPDGLNLLHRRVGRDSPDRLMPRGSFTINGPATAIREAWMDGWTGRGVNVLIIDTFGLEGVTPPDADPHRHGYLVTLAALQVAIAANYYALNAELGDSGLTYRQGGLRDIRTNAAGDKSTRFHAVNLSFGTPVNPRLSVAHIQAYRSSRASLFDDISGRGEFPNSGDAVIVTSAGNDASDAEWSPSNSAFVRDADTGPRTLIVGALSRNSLASNSNFAGDHPSVYTRFVVADGRTPIRFHSQLCDRDVLSSCVKRHRLDNRGVATSFAAPKVTGYAALVRHKFPNLTGARTATILLDTATYDGLTGCEDPSATACLETYGQGRVSLGRALAPVGRLQ